MKDRFDEAVSEAKAVADKYPDLISAALIAVAVERRVITQHQAEHFVRTYELSDSESVIQALSRAVDRSGRREEFVELLKEGRRAFKRAKRLLELAERARR
jgi:hypothetical protein